MLLVLAVVRAADPDDLTVLVALDVDCALLLPVLVVSEQDGGRNPASATGPAAAG
ncbi:hypothetical protein ABZ714_00145 [Streptomyces sp. NPDC006798]|uniref:hypothetical protein n=1 Tax=Streptomyces sp. NPDC006798 TaxID=3155462 RepID=UPI0033D7D7CB